MNEEEIKIKIVLPFLERLGILPFELKFEKSFFLKVGRHVLGVTPEQKRRDGVGARLDILITRNGRNLLVLEIKEADHIFEDADRDQAISYARLVHPIAPYALVTNGQDWKLFDSITKERITPAAIKLENAFDLVLPDDLRNEALELFLGFSLENINKFCAQQVEEQMKPLIGSPFELTRKFIPELNVPRSDLVQKLDNFVQSHKEGFLVLADSGMGKTSALCHYALGLLEKQIPVLFFWGWALEDGLLLAVADEFNWSFSEEQSPIHLFRRLHGVLKERQMVIIVDAVDEWQFSQKAQNLLKVLRAVRGLHVKFVISCKASSWDTFSKTQGGSTGIEEYLFHIPTSETVNVAYILKEFDSQEFYQAVQKYREVFNFKGGIEDRVLNEAKRNPFLLRVLFVVASQAGLKNVTFSSTQLFEEYYKRILEKTGNVEIAAAQLKSIAKCVWEENHDWIEMSLLRERVGLGLNETLLSGLFEHNILIRSSTNDERIGFYFQQFRDFIICFKVLAWQKLNDNEFQCTVQAFQKREQVFQQEGVHADVLSLYFRQASKAHKRILVGDLYQKAHKYLDRYVEIIEKHFPVAKEIFEPHTKGQIGFVGEVFVIKKSLGGYGFRNIDANEESIIFVPVNEMFSRSNLSYLHGAGNLHWSGSANGFINININQEVLEHEIISQLEKLVETKCLYEDKNPDLMQIRVTQRLLTYRDIFRPLFDPSGNWLQYPINFSRIEELLHRGKLQRALRDDLIEQKRTRGDVKEIKTNSGVLSSFSFSPADEQLLKKRLNEVITTGSYPETMAHYADLEEVEQLLRRASPTLEQTLKEFNGPPRVERYVLVDELRRNPQEGLAFAKDYLTKLISAFLENYKSLVDVDFPTLKHSFTLRKRMPVTILVGVAPNLAAGVNSNWWGGPECLVSSVLCKNPRAQANSVIACDFQELPKPFEDFRFRGEDYEMLEYSSGSFINYTSSDLLGESPLHNLVYKIIQNELPMVLDTLRKLEGKGP